MVFGGRAGKRPETQIDILPQGETDTVAVFLQCFFCHCVSVSEPKPLFSASCHLHLEIFPGTIFLDLIKINESNQIKNMLVTLLTVNVMY